MTELYSQQNYKTLRKKLRKSMPKGEVLLWQRLKGKQVGYRFRRQFSIGKNVVDFFCPKLNFGIEVDGLSHEGDKPQQHDQVRQK